MSYHNLRPFNLREMDPRELIRGLMRGDRSELKLGYSPANAVLAVQRLHPSIKDDEMRGYSEGFSDGMQRMESMVVGSDGEGCAEAVAASGLGLTYYSDGGR